MIDMPLSMFAWLIVVLFQAVIHYLVIGPRSRLRQLEEEIQSEVGELSNEGKNDIASTANLDEPTSRQDSEITNDFSVEESEGNGQLHEQDQRHPEDIPPINRISRSRSCPSPTTVAACHDNMTQEINPAEDEDDVWSSSSCIEGQDFDDQWRNEIIKYYSTSSTPLIPGLDEEEKRSDQITSKRSTKTNSRVPMNVRVVYKKNEKPAKSVTFATEEHEQHNFAPINFKLRQRPHDQTSRISAPSNTSAMNEKVNIRPSVSTKCSMRCA